MDSTPSMIPGLDGVEWHALRNSLGPIGPQITLYHYRRWQAFVLFYNINGFVRVVSHQYLPNVGHRYQVTTYEKQTPYPWDGPGLNRAAEWFARKFNDTVDGFWFSTATTSPPLYEDQAVWEATIRVKGSSPWEDSWAAPLENFDAAR